MKIFSIVIFLVLAVPSFATGTVPSSVQGILNSYCIDCHGEGDDVQLHNFADLGHDFQSTLLNKVEEQLYLKKMPPEAEDQLSEDELQQLLAWVNSQYETLGETSKFREKLKTPAYGNYVNHDDLFSGDYADQAAFTYDRRWLISEFIFDARFNQLIGYVPFRTINGERQYVIGDNNRRINLTNPFLLPTNTGVRYYDNTTLNGGHLLTMIANAKEISKFLMAERQMRSIGPMYDIMKLEFTHINTLANRENFLKANMHELAIQIYKDENKDYLPPFTSLNIQKSPTHDADGKPIKMPNHDVAAPRAEYPAIKTAIKKYYKDNQTEAELIRLCEMEWHTYGVHKLKIASRVGFMTNYMVEIIKRNRFVPVEYKPPTFKPDDFKLYSEIILKYRKKSDVHHDVIKKCLDEWKQGFDAEREAIGPPKDEEIIHLVKYLFTRILNREATETDVQKNLSLMKSYISTLGTKTAMSKLIETLILRSEFVYRYEFGQGREDAHGRRMLSPVDASIAIAYAITDSIPDKQLREAVQAGKLSTREDYRREVVRMLKNREQYYIVDDRLGKGNGSQYAEGLTNTPVRKLRFFREFFGYPKFLAIFKDNKRFGGMYNRSTFRLLYECDMLVDHILEKDQAVFEELLTTEKFYVYHSGDNEKMKEASNAVRKQYDYFKDMDWEEFTWDDVLEHKEFIQETNFSLLRNAGDLRGFKNKMTDVTLRFANGQKTAHPHQSKLARSIAGNEMRMVSVAKFFNIKLDEWDYPATQPAYLPNRKGILTHPAWLMAHSQNTATDPVIRGKWVREKLLAGTVPDVPITVEAVIPEDHHKTLRMRLVGVTENKECWKCHKYMNPLGYSFEMYDDFGRYRQEESLEHPDNLIKKGLEKAAIHVDLRDTYKTLSVDSKGHLDGTGDNELDGDVDDAIDLMERLSKSTRVRQSIIRHAFRYFMGRNELLSDSKTLIDADNAYVDSGGSFDAVIVSLLTSDSFIYRKETADDQQHAAAKNE
ncbi:MAG: DUF1588 domain-containing protein [Pirellulales bacterium]